MKSSFLYLSLLLTILFGILLGCSPKSHTYHTFQANNARTGYVDRPEIDQPKVLWKTHIGIQGYLNNSVVDQHIYVGSSGSEHNTKDAMDGVYCLNRKKGNIRWHFRTELDACGVAFSDNKIYSTGDDGYLRCLNAKNGEELWNIKREGELYSQPLIVDNKVMIGDKSGNILMVDKNSGEILFEKKIADSNIRGGLSSDNEFIYVAFLEGKVVCMDLEGNQIWETQVEFYHDGDLDFESIYGAPTVLDTQLIITYARSTFYNIPAIYSYNKTNGDLNWPVIDSTTYIEIGPGYGNIRSSVAIWKNHALYGAPYSNYLNAFNLESGYEVWDMRIGRSSHYHYPSPLIANNTLYLARHDGGLNAIDLEKQEIKWQLFLGWHDKVELRPEDYGRNGVWASVMGFPIPSLYASPSIDKKGNLYIGSGEGWFFAIGHAPIKK